MSKRMFRLASGREIEIEDTDDGGMFIADRVTPDEMLEVSEGRVNLAAIWPTLHDIAGMNVVVHTGGKTVCP
jgi:hypothetical protein